LTDNVNLMAANLTGQVRNIAEVTTAVVYRAVEGIRTLYVTGVQLCALPIFNTMVDQLNAFSGEVTRVAREVGIDGKLGGQANVRSEERRVGKESENGNAMAANRNSQVRNIAEVTTAVAKCELSKKSKVDGKG